MEVALIAAQQVEMAAAPAPAPDVQKASRTDKPVSLSVAPKHDCGGSDSDEVVVCGRRNEEQFRLRPLPPPPVSSGFLSRPLRVKIAPGVSLGFQQGGGFGLKAELGPGKKTGDAHEN